VCGICGIFNTDNSPVDQVVIKRMTDVLARRGPDGEGHHVSGNIGLGHRRLAIIDIQTGAQPIFNEDNRIVTVCNGEIYNYLELRELLLSLGHKFRTKSDTEVIVHAYEEWGMECVRSFNGMWAFAVWDSRKRGLFLSRDRLGEKPLYYRYENNCLHFASEIKGILAAGIKPSPAHELIPLYLSLGYIPAPYSFYNGIKKIMPGHSLWLDKDGLKESCYWALPQVPAGDMERDAAKAEKRFEELFSDSVRLRMRSDVPFGAFLSGGLDSSSVVGQMADFSQTPVETFTIGFKEKDFDERGLARLVAERFGTNHHEEEVTGGAFDENVQTILDCYDEPFGDSSAIPTGIVSQKAARRVKMVLAGDGGDEVLSGYPAYQVEKAVAGYNCVPRVFRSVARGLWSSFRPVVSGTAVYRWNRVVRMLATMEMSFEERLAEKIFWISPCALRGLFPDRSTHIDPVDFLVSRLLATRNEDTFYRLMHFHFAVPLADDMLAKVDRVSMHSSLEVRLPFLDFRLVEYAAGLDKRIKMRGFERKSILRRTFGKRLPAPLLRQPKKGFVVPIREWFKDESFRARLQSLSTLSGWGFDVKALGLLASDHVSGKKDHGQILWVLFLLKAWLEK